MNDPAHIHAMHAHHSLELEMEALNPIRPSHILH